MTTETTPPPVKPVGATSAEARAWNKYVSAQIDDRVSQVLALLAQVSDLEDEFVPGGSSQEQEVAWSQIRFSQRLARSWELHREVSAREIAARWAPSVPPADPTIPTNLPIPQAPQ